MPIFRPWERRLFVGRGSRARRARYLAAAREGYARNYDALGEFFAEAMERRREWRRPLRGFRIRAPSKTEDSRAFSSSHRRRVLPSRKYGLLWASVFMTHIIVAKRGNRSEILGLDARA